MLLYQSPLGQVARQRLGTMRETTDGFEIARRDLEIRGPGEFLGARQSGQALLRFADLETDQWLVEEARDQAQRLLREDLATVAAHLARWLGSRKITCGSDRRRCRLLATCANIVSMTLTELKYIVAVAREKHFGHAAEACFVAQPTLSVAIKKLRMNWACRCSNAAARKSR